MTQIFVDIGIFILYMALFLDFFLFFSSCHCFVIFFAGETLKWLFDLGSRRHRRQAELVITKITGYGMTAVELDN